MQQPHKNFDSILRQIATLPDNWHAAGTANLPMMETIAKYAGGKLTATAETGSGKTTLLFSHISEHHTVFAVEGDNRSISAVKDSAIFNPTPVHWVPGVTQKTLPHHTFERPLQMVLIDGPHGFPFPEMEYYYFYPQLEAGGILIIDDIQIPTIRRLHEFLNEDEMFEFLETVGTTAFYRRTTAPTFNPIGDGWWEQQFNLNHAIVDQSFNARLRRMVPKPVKATLKRVLGRN